MKYMKNCKGLFVVYLIMVPAASIASVLFSLGLGPLINVATTNDRERFMRALLLERLLP